MNKQKDLAERQNLVVWKCRLVLRAMLPLVLIAAGMLAGCQTQPREFPSTDAAKGQAVKPSEPTTEPAESNTLDAQATNPEISAADADEITMREGDIVKVLFPGSPTLDTIQQIQRDGRINLPLVGEVQAAGMTVPALETNLVNLYAPQLVTKQVTVEVESSSFPVYVTGMVLKPGEVLSNHPISALEAIMEAGGFDYTKANFKNVRIIRQEGNTMKTYTLNLKAVLQGKESEPFFLKPGDIVFVPERFSMF